MPRSPARPSLSDLSVLALDRGGYFDRRDAHQHGITDSLLGYHTRRGHFDRVLPGVYRLHVAPVSRFDEPFLAWVWTNYRGAISHESALALYDLGDVLPARIHVTVPRPFHRVSAPFQVHLSPLPPEDVQVYNGFSVTAPARSIADAAANGTDPEQIYKVVHDALARGLVDPDALRTVAKRQPNQHTRDVGPLISDALAHAT